MSEEDETYVLPARHTAYCDFDGVIHSYTSGWQGADVIPDPPIVDGNGVSAIDFLNELSEHYEVVIFTTRARYPEAIPVIHEWLREHGFQGGCEVTDRKGPGVIYIDDRGWRFRGIFPPMKFIRNAHPWRMGDRTPEPVSRKIAKKNQSLISLERKLGARKFQLRELKRAAQAVVDYYSVDGSGPPELDRLRSLIATPERSKA